MNLYLLRHALAIEVGTAGISEDAARPLTPKGRRQTRHVAAALQAMEINFDLILTSPLRRAQQTAEIIALELRRKNYLQFSEALKPGGSPDHLIRQINRLKPQPENLLLVGHEPELGKLISLLVTATAYSDFPLKKAGLAKLEIEKLRPTKCAALLWFLTPKQMKLMS